MWEEVWVGALAEEWEWAEAWGVAWGVAWDVGWGDRVVGAGGQVWAWVTADLWERGLMSGRPAVPRANWECSRTKRKLLRDTWMR